LNMALMNVILASVVDAVGQARLANNAYVVHQKERELIAARKLLEESCKRMDQDGSGFLTFEEIKNGYNTEPEFRMCLEAMDIKAEDLATVWAIMDTDESGDVSYLEFCEQVFKMKTSDTHTMLIFVKHYVGSIHKEVHQAVTMLRTDVMSQIKEENTKLGDIVRSVRQEHQDIVDMENMLQHTGIQKGIAAPASLQQAEVASSLLVTPATDDSFRGPPRVFDDEQQRYMCNFVDAVKELEQKLDDSLATLSSMIAGMSKGGTIHGYPLQPMRKADPPSTWQLPTCCSAKQEAKHNESANMTVYDVAQRNALGDNRTRQGIALPEILRADEHASPASGRRTEGQSQRLAQTDSASNDLFIMT